MGAYEFDLWVFMLAAFLGFQLIRGVSPLLQAADEEGIIDGETPDV